MRVVGVLNLLRLLDLAVSGEPGGGDVLASGVVAVGVLFWLAWGALRRLALALAGAVFLVCFVMIRAVSFHPIDRLLELRIGMAKMNWVLEVGGILCVGLGAWLNLRGDAKAQPASDP